MNKRYELRPWSLSDCRSLAEYANNIHVWNNLRDGFPSPYTEEDVRVYIANTLTKDCVQDFAIIVDGKAVGGIGFIPQVDVERYSAEIGYWLGEPYWGCGIMSKVVSEVVEYVFATTELVRLYASVFESNPASRKVLEKCGFRLVGIMHKAVRKNDRWVDMCYYEILKSSEAQSKGKGDDSESSL